MRAKLRVRLEVAKGSRYLLGDVFPNELTATCRPVSGFTVTPHFLPSRLGSHFRRGFSFFLLKGICVQKQVVETEIYAIYVNGCNFLLSLVRSRLQYYTSPQPLLCLGERKSFSVLRRLRPNYISQHQRKKVS